MFSNHIEKDLHKQILSREGFTSEMFIVKEGPGMESDLSFIDEGKVYGPEEASLLLVTEHFLKFSCNFDLNVFPFDKQTCQVQVREWMNNLTKSYNKNFFQLKVPDTKKSLFELTSGDPEAEDMPRKLSNFIVTNVYTNATPEMVSLAIDIQSVEVKLG